LKEKLWNLATAKLKKTLNFHQFQKQLAQNKNPEILDAVKWNDLTFK
jgi:hypothetical protein